MALDGTDSLVDAGRWLEAVRAPSTPGLRALLHARLGELDAALDVAATAPRAGEDASAARLAVGLVALARGDFESALLAFDDAFATARADRALLAQARASLAAADALLDRSGPVDGSAAVGRLAEARSLLESSDPQSPLRIELRRVLARARATTGDLDGAVAEAAATERDAIVLGSDELRARALATLAELESQRGGDFVARKHELAAVELLEGVALALPADRREGFWREPMRRRLRLRASATTDRRRAESSQGLDERLRRLFDVLKRVAREHEIERLLERITDAAVDLTGAERGFVLLVGSDGQLEPRLVRAAGTRPDDPSVAFSRSIAEAVLIDGEPIVTVDARDDRRLSEYLSVHKLLLKSVACVPIRGRVGVLGVLYLEHRVRRGRFAEDDLELLIAFADQAAIALENAELVAELESQRRALAETNRELEGAKAEIERVLVARTDELEETRRALDRARGDLRSRHAHHGMIGRSDAMRRVFAVIDRVCESDVPVVIHGESGTGKELAARAIHEGSARAKGPFVALNCAAIPESLLESELFGHVRGAFTGADRDRKGVLVRASGGTLFLDEIGDMPAKMQVDLLRVLQDGKVRPVGGEEETTVDVRIVSASNKRLDEQVAKGAFREDLYYRLNVVEVRLPPLRDRIGDVALLADHFLTAIARQEGRPRRRLSRSALERMEAFGWPGNVRQLEHVLLHACVMADGELLEEEDLALDGPSARSSTADAAGQPRSSRLESETRDAAAGAAAASAGPARVPLDEPTPQNVDDFKDAEKRRILAALESHHWNRARAARALGYPRRTFYRRLKEHGIL
jgi:transcriptional regulator with GAF, ATPase, and Fis domain